MNYHNEYITLPGSPFWNIINYNNNDFQPDYIYDLEKTRLTKLYIKKLLIPFKNTNKTYLEYYVIQKRSNL